MNTPLPWKRDKFGCPQYVGPNGRMVDVRVNGFTLSGEDEAKANTEFIVKAVNNHDKLVDALRKIAEHDGRDKEHGFLDEWSEASAFSECQEIARALLAELEQK